MRRLAVPEVYRGFSISFDLRLGVTFTDGRIVRTARSYRHARERIDAILLDRERRDAVAFDSGRTGQPKLL